jgi:hypothetical protein
MSKQGDREVNSWEKVETLLENIKPDTTTVITSADHLGDDGWRVRWCPGTDLEPLGGVGGDEDAQINYLTSGGDWLEVAAFEAEWG